MTLQNLSKILDRYESQLGSTDLEQFEILKGLPFYDWNKRQERLLPPITLYKISRSVTIPVIIGFSTEEDSDLTRIEEIPPSFISFTASAMTASSGRVTSSFSIRSSMQCLDEAKYVRISLLILYLVIDPLSSCSYQID